ncbi:peptidoglycan-binding domain-containing protein [Janibacter cremeus]|uniref:Peptidoglycan hydrolase-like protein with peptidoglycan-binding domain n=1 Tax=Janibacter cremeus TaxID=1285192 RepID=A0A852VRF9_9MICO|nr:peptidoglycan-binding protein [Janibacter cremeus]NYF98529.1 peptidoglycan hydrolase-like protein with peptidoglycan-binding domain [Janibacter cremeus]
MNVTPWYPLGAGDPRASLVAGAQHLLRHAGHAIVADGIFGPATESAVRDVQATVGLPATGEVDPDTWAQVVVPARPGDSGEAVMAIQATQLAAWIDEPLLLVDGDFGPVTQERVGRFQGMWGLTHDGIAGPETWSFVSAPPRDLWPLAKVGQTMAGNWRVRAVQHLLVHHGAGLTVDGDYGPATGEAMRQFQLGLRARYVSTTTGQLDWPALIVTVGPGASGPAVAAVQSLVSVPEDGAFGPVTEQAVRNLQSVFVPPDDGIVGPITWHMLVVPKSE